MNKNKNKVKVEGLLQEAIKIINRQEELQAIDYDLALEKMRRAYELLLFNKEDSPPEKLQIPKVEMQVKPDEKTDPVEIEDDIQESESQEDEIAQNELIPEIESEQKEVSPVIENKEEQAESTKEATVEIDLFGETEPTPKDKEPQTEPSGSVDLFSDMVKNEPAETLSDSLSKEMPEETLVDQFQKNKIEHLKEAIGINDKFFFLNELFEGDLSNYNQAIDTLDSFANIDEANRFIDALAKQNKWDEHEQAREQFLGFINRKFV